MISYLDQNYEFYCCIHSLVRDPLPELPCEYYIQPLLTLFYPLGEFGTSSCIVQSGDFGCIAGFVSRSDTD